MCRAVRERRAAARHVSDRHRELQRLTCPVCGRASTATGTRGEEDDDHKNIADEADVDTDKEEPFDVW